MIAQSARRCRDLALERRGAGAFALGMLGALVAAITARPAIADDKPATGRLVTQTIEITAKPITSFLRTGAGGRRHGKLDWRGGLVLTSPSPHFGGFSGLAIDADGRRLVAVTDAGAWLTAEIDAPQGQITGLKKARIGPLLGANGRPLTRDRDRDAESLTLLDGTLGRGTLLVGFERNQRIVRYTIDERGVLAPQAGLPLPRDARRMRSNLGLEALSVLAAGPHKGSPIAFAERFPDARGHHTGWLWTKGEPQRILMTDIGGYDLTDLAALPNGGLIVLERRFRWLEGVRMRLRRIAPGEIRPGALLRGDVLLEADLTAEIDNMEGLAVHRGAGGETVITLISDDNFNKALQRTILLQFALPAEAPPSASERRKSG